VALPAPSRLAHAGVSAPAAVAPAAALLTCPYCGRPLEEDAAGAACAACRRRYSRHHGILDLRVFPDPYLGLDEDRARADLVVAALDRLALPEILEHYWSLSETTPALLRRTFVQSALRAEARARSLRARIEADGVPLARSRVLEIGSGTGAFLAEAHGHVREIVGLDIALRWLHVSRRRFRDRGQPPPLLVCACAEHLPFEDGAFDVVVSTATLEFTRDVDRVLAECARVLRPGGRAYLTTVNRFSLGLEPHVRLWGVGWLPRAWQAGYVRRRGRGDFAKVRLLSFRELDRRAARHFARRRFEPPSVPEELRRELSAVERVGLRVYEAAARVGLVRALLRWVGPEWEVTLRKAY
jgi:ubiquinone/menaquinone biosynthesis C-methylase UbiE